MREANHRRVLLGTGMALAGTLFVVLGEMDDSPGLQLIGLIIAASGFYAALRKKVR